MFKLLPEPGDEAYINHGGSGVQRVKVVKILRSADGYYTYRLQQFDHWSQKWRQRCITVSPYHFRAP